MRWPAARNSSGVIAADCSPPGSGPGATSLDIQVEKLHSALGCQVEMTSKESKVELLQGTLDLIVLRALSTMGPQHAYGLAARLDQVAEHPLELNQGTLYPAL